MKVFRAGSATTVFIVFFGVALIEALAARKWALALLFVALALLSLRVDAMRRKRRAFAAAERLR